MIKITFLDGNYKEFDAGVTALDIASSISSSLAKKSVFAFVNDVAYDMKAPIEQDATVELVLEHDPRTIDVLNHSCSHLMASAIKKIYPNAMFGVGPSIHEGYYYDFFLDENVKLTEQDFSRIEKEMTRIVSQNVEFSREEVSKEKALELFMDDKYKQEIIRELPEGEIISIYKHADFMDLCRGPHVPSTKFLKNFKLLNISGAYWRGDSNNEQLQRIYGTCFSTKEDLENHLRILKERQERDHRKLGRELDLFMMSEYGPGFPFWLHKGMLLRRALEDYWVHVHTRENYQLISTPIMLNKELWEVSGHWNNYRENMYTSEIDKHEFAIKPMNCPGGMLVYKHSLHSYKDFPLRVGELGLVHRHEASGALAGLFRVRNFTQDDAHIFMREDQMVEEIGNVIQLFEEIYSVFGLQYHIELSTRPLEKYIGTVEIWDKAEKALADACIRVGRDFKVNPHDGAFYGPKLDFKLRDSMGRIWQCGTIQLDMNLPERFDLTYIDQDGTKKRPIMIHRAAFGSLERFIGILIEHYAGAFPTWLAPIQVKIIPVNVEIHTEYAQKLVSILKEQGIRVEIDLREEKLGYKIREAQTKKIPYQLVIGDEEVNNNTVNARKYGSSKTDVFALQDFVNHLQKEISSLGKEDNESK